MADNSGATGGIILTLEETLQRFVEQQVSHGGYTDAAAYLAHLVREEQKRLVRGRVTSLLKEGATSPFRECIEEDWNRLRATAVSAARSSV